MADTVEDLFSDNFTITVFPFLSEKAVLSTPYMMRPRPVTPADSDTECTDTDGSHDPTLFKSWKGVRAVVHEVERRGEINETTPLLSGEDVGVVTSFLPPDDDIESVRGEGAYGKGEDMKRTTAGVWAVLSVLLIGVFISQADTSLVLATYGQISSEFNDLDSGSWLLSSYMLSMCVTQPLYGKLSDIFGRKALLQFSYAMFAIGAVVCGVGQTMGQVIAGRAIGGAGGSGMVSLVSILITDLVPLAEVASYRSYVNIAQTVGRSCGGIVGGYLAQTIGWRWAFLGQAPLTVIAMLLVWIKLRATHQTRAKADLLEIDQVTVWTKLRRVDFAGAACMSIAIAFLLVALDMDGEQLPWSHPLLCSFLALGFAGAAAFYFVEKYWAEEPVFPLKLLGHYDVLTAYAVITLQTAAQVVMMLLIPLYFQITQNATTGEAGAYLVPAVVGNAVGGLLVGAYIKRTGGYKAPTIVSSLSSMLAYTLVICLWQGKTSPWQSLFAFPGGFGTAAAHSACFVAVAAGIDESDMAIAASGMYFCFNVGAVAGLSAGSAIFQAMLRKNLNFSLHNVGNGAEIANRALSDVNFVQRLSDTPRRLVVKAYVDSFRVGMVFPLTCAVAALLVGLISREHRLRS